MVTITPERSVSHVPGLQSGDFVVVEYPGSDEIYGLVFPPRAPMLVLSGRVGLAHISSEGRRIFTEFRQPGDLFGRLSAGAESPESESAIAIGGAKIAEVNARALRRLVATDPDWLDRLMAIVNRRLERGAMRMQELMFTPVEGRIVGTLLELAQEDEVHLTHQLVADMAGTYRETATRILNDLRRAGSVHLRRGVIEICDRPSLRALYASSSAC